MSPIKAIRTISLIGAFVLVASAARAVVPPPDGGYPNGNTAEGEDACFQLTTGYDNTAVGFNALYSCETSDANTALGWRALFSDTTGSSNTAIGLNALAANTVGSLNTATGVQALLNNTTGEGNTASGVSALYANSSGSNNTALGKDSLSRNTAGFENTAVGFNALLNNTTGSYNTASGFAALGRVQRGNYNIALGYAAGFDRQTGNENIDIGNRGVSRESHTIRIGTRPSQRAAFIAGISGVTVPEGVPVIVDGSGHLGTSTSSARFKEQIQPMDKMSETIFSLQPVTFRYRHQLDPNGIAEFGLVAEEVEKVNPDLVARDDTGKPYSVRYDAINAMLLNEFLKEHRKVEELTSSAATQEATIARQQKQIDALTTGLQKVSDELKMRKPLFANDNQ